MLIVLRRAALLISLITAFPLSLSGAEPLTKDQLVDFVKAEVSDEVITKYIEKSGIDFEPTAQIIVELKKAGLSSAVIAKLLDAPCPELAQEREVASESDRDAGNGEDNDAGFFKKLNRDTVQQWFCQGLSGHSPTAIFDRFFDGKLKPEKESVTEDDGRMDTWSGAARAGTNSAALAYNEYIFDGRPYKSFSLRLSTSGSWHGLSQEEWMSLLEGVPGRRVPRTVGQGINICEPRSDENLTGILPELPCIPRATIGFSWDNSSIELKWDERGEWPSTYFCGFRSSEGRRPQRPATTHGCALASLQSANLQSGSLSDTSNNTLRDQIIERELRLLNTGFLVSPRFYLYDDGESPNALATPERIDLSPRFPDGTVLLGFGLMREEFAQSETGEGYAVPAIMAHEFAHIVQFKAGIQLPTKLMELQADFLAGWYLANRRNFIQTEVVEPLRSFFQKGDYSFNSLDHHGTPKERLAAISAGLMAGRLHIKEAFNESLHYVKSP